MRKAILVANTGWYLYNFRFSFAKSLRSEGYDVVMLFPHDKYADAIEAEGFRVINWKLERKIASIWEEIESIYQVTKIYKTEKPNVVHHFTIKPVIYGSLAARWARIPLTINSITGRGYIFLSSGWKTISLRWIVKHLLRMGQLNHQVATTFENEFDKEFFTTSGMVPSKNSYLINGVGVDIRAFNYYTERNNDPPVVVFPGRLLWDKGVGTLIKAARSIKQNNKVRIILVGEPDPGNPNSITEEKVQEWADEGIIEWWGWQTNMRLIYHQANIVVLPSFGEGMSKALLEAAACGRPIIATDVPGCREVVVDGVTGYLVPVDDAASLANRLTDLMQNPDLRMQMGKMGRKLIEEKFSDSIIINELLSIYRNLCC